MLQADLNKSSSPHWYCSTEEKDYNLWLYFSNLAPFKSNCWLDNMRLKWHNGQRQDFGVNIKLVGDRIGNADIEQGFSKNLWGDLLSGVADLGYSGTSPYVGALHYDWRLSPDDLIASGTFAKVKSTIEEFVAKSGGRKAVLVSLSYGGPLTHRFLSTFVDSAWKNKYIERWISLSGVFGGSAELTRMAFYPEAADFFHVPELLPYISLEAARDVSNTFPSSFALEPAFLRDDEVLLRATLAGESKTYSKNDVGKALADAGLHDAKEVLEASNMYRFHELSAPGVPVDCVYGIGDKTINSLTFDDGFDKPATSYQYEDGDGVAPTRSLARCAEWNNITLVHRFDKAVSRGSDATPLVSVYAYPKIGHGGTLHSKEAVSAFSQIMHRLHSHKLGEAAPAKSVLV